MPEVLENMKVNELLKVAKSLNISGRHDMRKQQLIDAIQEVQQPKSLEEDLSQGIEAQWDDPKSNKEQYLENAKIGMLIAFKVNDRKALSGKIEEIHGAGFVVKTKNGVKFNVRKKNVMWVKTGDRWPRGVYLALKGESLPSGHQAAN